MIDMHVHILPGIDDGARDEAMTRAMMRRAAEAGISYIVCTPHVYRPEDQARNRNALAAGRRIAHEYGVGMAMGCELNYRALAALKGDMQALGAFCLGPTRCLLLELPGDHAMPGWEYVISDMTDAGYLPIIAHPERYSYIQKDEGAAQAMVELGCELQIDAGGLMAGLMSAERRTARRLLKAGLVSYIASDAHTPKDYDAFEKAYGVFCGEWPQENRLTDALRRYGKEKRG